jgi:hypothetical protein
MERHTDWSCFAVQKMTINYILYVQSFRGADCNTDHNLLVAKHGEAICKLAHNTKFYVQRTDLKKLHTHTTHSYDVLWQSFPFIPIFGSPCNNFPISPTPWHCCQFPLAEFAVEGKALTVWATDRHLLTSKFIYPGFQFRKSLLPRFLPVGQALRGLLFWFAFIWFIFCYYYYIYYLLSQYCIFCRVLWLNTIFILLLLLKGYVKLLVCFGSFLAADYVHRSTTPFYRVRV